MHTQCGSSTEHSGLTPTFTPAWGGDLHVLPRTLNTATLRSCISFQTTNKPLVYMSQLGSCNRSLHSREDTPTPSSNPSSGCSHFSFSLSIYFFLSLPIPGGERGISSPSPARWYCQLISQRPSEVPVGTETTIPRIPWGKLPQRLNDSTGGHPRDIQSRICIHT